MSVYKTKDFARFARRSGLADDDLLGAATAVSNGRWDADLGGGVFKQRVARAGGGKSGGFRTIIVFRAGGHSFFVFGFAKSEKANVSTMELGALKKLARDLLGLDAKTLAAMSAAGELVEIEDRGEDIDQG
ncbi:type II toxin-antitoxin system RelE/ParE family toxin [Phenylobacterium sp.]|uniref:type II toxin-antitoxin system RelE/ParE family toxin n=1 Tax=Phenylobacterium sp. TaxID=1871053 RepID=UPI0011F84D54|nr:type II toxin-antitoxin system RelE/ParE family toxin [Phenylobacterium sp.]THD53047.1 MAG: type II toxin-antitoxin system RelE/ParE family toxin [Phenylobacterium sp.]